MFIKRDAAKWKTRELTGKIIGAAMAVHRALGPGFLESVYHNALLFELRRIGLQAEPKIRIQVRTKELLWATLKPT